MIKINDRFHLETDPHQWILIEQRTGVNKKTGEKTLTPHRSYPGTLLQACMTIVDVTGKECETTNDLILAILVTKEEIIGAIQDYSERVGRLGI